MIDDIEDNYPEYLADERGYAWDAWDVLAADVIRRHDAIARASADDLAALDPAGLDDLDRWAFARASRELMDLDGFFDAARLVMASSDEHRGVSYAEVFISAIEALSDAGLGDEASLHLRTFRERWPEDTQAARLSVWIAARGPDLATSLEDAIAELMDDAEAMFEIGEDLAAIGASEHALTALDAAAALADTHGLRALLLDIALLRADLAATE